MSRLYRNKKQTNKKKHKTQFLALIISEGRWKGTTNENGKNKVIFFKIRA